MLFTMLFETTLFSGIAVSFDPAIPFFISTMYHYIFKSSLFILLILISAGCYYDDTQTEISLEILNCHTGESIPVNSKNPLLPRFTGLQLPPDGLNADPELQNKGR